MERKRVLVNLDISAFYIGHKHTVLESASESMISPARAQLTATLSVARFSFFICCWASSRSSVEPLALRLVRGVEPPAVEAALEVTPEPDLPLAAFSANRFCLDAEGAMMVASTRTRLC